MSIFDLSLRHKIPLWGSLLIFASALAIATALMFRAYDDLKEDLYVSSESLGQTLAKTLFPTLLHDDLWRAFEIVRAPFHAEAIRHPLEPDAIFVINDDMNILVASDPRQYPTLAVLDEIGPSQRQLAEHLRSAPVTQTRALDLKGSRHYYVAIPIAEAGRQLGVLVIGHDRETFWIRFTDLALRGGVIGALVVAIILPINWYWGRRTAEPLVELARGMDALVHGHPASLPAAERYAYRDELGQLFAAYRDAATALGEKALLEQEVVRSERLAAVGRLAAGIAHEVNNPLGGMLMALDNLKQRGPLDPATAKTVGLLERGLQQVAETIGALLVEARITSRSLNRHDFDDVRTLIEPQTTNKQIALDWHDTLPEDLPVPAGIVRQILINLLLNAVQATEAGGHIRVTVGPTDHSLAISVANSGPPLPEVIREHLFEPFVSGREGGHGLGLWVTYQTVTQLGGQIAVGWQDDEVIFTVKLPLENASA